jgi:hypothetical protein
VREREERSRFAEAMRATSMRAGVRPGSAKPERGASSYTSRAPSLRRLYPARSLSLLAALAFALTVVVVLLTAHTGRTVHRTPVVPVVPALKAPPVKVSSSCTSIHCSSIPSCSAHPRECRCTHCESPPSHPASTQHHSVSDQRPAQFFSSTGGEQADAHASTRGP